MDTARLPVEGVTTVIILAELNAGVLATSHTAIRARRMDTLTAVSSMQVLPIDEAAARHWARLQVQLFEAGRKANVNDLWVASIALSNDLPLVTQDADVDVIAGLGGLHLIRV